ncbi:hypothetical protein BE221DRAFT_79590 [Ostreococcus tauri]|uniref:Uncharacterized protein n=1 Tax=Ostreococcus tauri TaxID=70448 RepID=A0A1Y5I3I7_OSTTA|nr:hypothetical protein BE221DRAFT_79590 [Ostreococcus tauri]
MACYQSLSPQNRRSPWNRTVHRTTQIFASLRLESRSCPRATPSSLARTPPNSKVQTWDSAPSLPTNSVPRATRSRR